MLRIRTTFVRIRLSGPDPQAASLSKKIIYFKYRSNFFFPSLTFYSKIVLLKFKIVLFYSQFLVSYLDIVGYTGKWYRYRYIFKNLNLKKIYF